jgi:hypothetical protein
MPLWNGCVCSGRSLQSGARQISQLLTHTAIPFHRTSNTEPIRGVQWRHIAAAGSIFTTGLFASKTCTLNLVGKTLLADDKDKNYVSVSVTRGKHLDSPNIYIMDASTSDLEYSSPHSNFSNIQLLHQALLTIPASHTSLTICRAPCLHRRTPMRLKIQARTSDKVATGAKVEACRPHAKSPAGLPFLRRPLSCTLSLAEWTFSRKASFGVRANTLVALLCYKK